MTPARARRFLSTKLLLLVALATVIAAAAAPGDPPTLLSYQARLTSTNGTPITQPQLDVTFRIYDSPLSGTMSYTEQHLDIAVTDGLLSVLIGSIVPLDPALFESPTELYLGVQVEADAEMSPRVRLASVPFAFRASEADDVPGKDITPNSITIGGQTVIDSSGQWGGTLPGVPSGTILMTGASAAPAGFVLCDGTAYSQANPTFSQLFASIGTAYGTAGAGTFRVPDLRQRFPMGKATSGTGSVLGVTGGTIDHAHSMTHTHTTPAHTHTVSAHGHSTTGPGADIQITQTDTTSNHAHAIGAKFGAAIASVTTNRFLEAGTGGSAEDIQAGTINTGAHAHGHNNFSGRVGNTARDGDIGFLTPAGEGGSPATGPASASSTGANNPPFQTVNYIIKL